MQRNTRNRSAHAHRCRLCAEFMSEHMHSLSVPAPTCSMIASAHEERRRYRLTHPTPGEAALRALFIALDFRVILSPQPFEYIHWRHAKTKWLLSSQDALAEGGVGPYFCDVLIPARGLAIEVEGRIHRLTRDHDERRYHILAAQGLTVLVLQEHHVLDATSGRQHLLPFLRQ
jgi:very-short-patch-repair endonuclease